MDGLVCGACGGTGGEYVEGVPGPCAACHGAGSIVEQQESIMTFDEWKNEWEKIPPRIRRNTALLVMKSAYSLFQTHGKSAGELKAIEKNWQGANLHSLKAFVSDLQNTEDAFALLGEFLQCLAEAAEDARQQDIAESQF